MELVKMDNSKLKTITNASNTSAATMTMLALRERNARNGYSNITALRQQLIRMGEKVVDAEFDQFWKDLEQVGIGNLIIGRRGNPDRFKWYYSVKEVAKAAIEGKELEVKQFAKKKESRPIVKRRKRAGRKAKVVNQTYTNKDVLRFLTKLLNKDE